MDHFGGIMFTPAVRAQQERRGSRSAYAKITAQPAPDALSEREMAFIAARDSFYMATVTETGWPYVQHRGGPRGFLKVLGPTTLGFADYRGNRQYVSTANLAGDGRAALILVDYAHQARLKILGHGRVQEADDAPDLAARLDVEGGGRVERLFTIEVAAFDWNCPQFITPRFTEAEARAALGDRLAALEAENAGLRARLAAIDSRG